jgi:NTF2 fold immunity protein of polymorphic toxin system component
MRISVISFYLLTVALAFGQGSRPQKDGYVPDSTTAIKVAEAVLVPVFGKKLIESEEPFTAKLKDDVWTVSGTLYCSDRKGGRSTGNCDGGVAVVQISKVDAHVISMIHGK